MLRTCQGWLVSSAIPPGQIDGSVELPESGQSTKKPKVGDIESSDWDEKESEGQSNNQLSPWQSIFDLDHCPDITDLLKGQERDRHQANKVVLIISPEKNRTDPGYHVNDELKSMDGDKWK